MSKRGAILDGAGHQPLTSQSNREDEARSVQGKQGRRLVRSETLICIPYVPASVRVCALAGVGPRAEGTRDGVFEYSASLPAARPSETLSACIWCTSEHAVGAGGAGHIDADSDFLSSEELRKVAICSVQPAPTGGAPFAIRSFMGHCACRLNPSFRGDRQAFWGFGPDDGPRIKRERAAPRRNTSWHHESSAA